MQLFSAISNTLASEPLLSWSRGPSCRSGLLAASRSTWCQRASCTPSCAPPAYSPARPPGGSCLRLSSLTGTTRRMAGN